MAFEGLTEKLQGALRKLSSKGKLTEDNVKEGMREVRMALLEADVNYAVAKDFIKKVKKCEIKGGIVEGAVTGAKDLDAIADLPSRDVLIARLLGSMMSPISGLAIVLDQIAKQKGEGAPAADAE